MIVVVRRVLSAAVIVEETTVSEIDKGLLLYVGLALGDTEKDCEYFAKKTANLRIFDSPSGEISVKDAGGEILSVSQFTLLAETKKGNRPTYSKAMPSSESKHLFDYFNECLQKEAEMTIQTGVFGAEMTIPAVDDGPFTILITRD